MRLNSQSGEDLGTMSFADALGHATPCELDVVEVAPLANPPVRKLANWSKQQFLRDKEIRAQRRKQSATQTIKEIQLHPATHSYDLDTKADGTVRFLEKSHRVRVTVVLHGRYVSHLDVATARLDRFCQTVSGSFATTYYEDMSSQRRVSRVLQSEKSPAQSAS